MILTVLTPPVGEPVSLAEAKDYLRIGHDGEDALIAALIRSARARLEQLSGLALVSRTLQLSLSEWPSALFSRGVEVRPGPVQALLSVTLQPDGEDVTARFVLRDGRLYLRSGAGLPSLFAGGEAEVSFDVGFGSPEAVPGDLKLAVKRLTSEAYRARDTGGAELPGDLAEIVSSYLGARI